jgi:hypothetical protein
LSESTRGNGVNTYNMQTGILTVEFRDADNKDPAEFSNTNKDNGALDAHWEPKNLRLLDNSPRRNSLMTQERPLKVMCTTANYDNAYWNRCYDLW